MRGADTNYSIGGRPVSVVPAHCGPGAEKDVARALCLAFAQGHVGQLKISGQLGMALAAPDPKQPDQRLGDAALHGCALAVIQRFNPAVELSAVMVENGQRDHRGRVQPTLSGMLHA